MLRTTCALLSSLCLLALPFQNAQAASKPVSGASKARATSSAAKNQKTSGATKAKATSSAAKNKSSSKKK